jgi:hypothetical protein
MNNLKNEKGYALLVALIAIVFITIIGFSLFTITNVTHSQSTNERKDQSIFYVAEAGLNIKEARLQQKIQKAYEEAKLNDVTFETVFNTKLLAILNEEKTSTYGANVFKNTFNGNPTATVTIDFQPHTVRSFKIISSGALNNLSKKRVVEKSYTIPNVLLTKTTIQMPVSNGTSPTTSPPQTNTAPSISVQPTANIYLTKGIFLDAVQRNNIKFKANATFDKNNINFFKYINTRVTPLSVLNDVSYGQPAPTYTIPKKTHAATPSYAESTSGTLSLANTVQTISKNLKVPTFNFKNNLVLNLSVPSDTHTLYFDGLLTDYNFTTLRLNVTGNGTLNLVFKNHYELSLGHKFYIHAPNTKVNTIFKQYAHIHGEFTAQDVYMVDNAAKESALIVYNKGKFNASNIYSGHADITKYLGGNYKVTDTISIKEGNIEANGKGGIYANQIQLQNGYVNLTGSALNITTFAANTIIIENKNLNLNAYSCTTANQIFVPKGDLNIHGNANFNKAYANIWYSTIGLELNTKSCTNEPFVITPPENEIPQQYVSVDEFTYLYDDSYLQISPLVEVN